MPTTPPTIYILSGGVGSSGEHLVNTVLAQYPDSKVNISIIGSIHHPDEALDLLSKAQAENALVVHTFVNQSMREYVNSNGLQLGVQEIDLTGQLFDWLTPALEQQPVGRPGLYRQLRRQYFERVAAIEYTMAQDDGKNPEGWSQADVVLVGVSRVGKTPLSLYLAVLGWKVANYPLVPEIPVPKELFEINPSRVIGLTIDLGQLLSYRMQRQARLGTTGTSAYIDPEAVATELQEAKRLFRRGGFHILNMTDKTIEMGADEIEHLVSPHRSQG
jgi:hypothetical protein